MFTNSKASAMEADNNSLHTHNYPMIDQQPLTLFFCPTQYTISITYHKLQHSNVVMLVRRQRLEEF